MTNPLPRSILPDTWAAKTRCPICSAGALQVLHLPAAPDQMACRICQSAFEVEEHGEHLRFTQLAQPLAEILANRWVTMAAVREAIHNARRAVENRQPARSAAEAPFFQPPSAPAFEEQPLEPPSPGGRLTDGEVLAKARALYRLGNSHDQIEDILRRNPKVTSEQIQAARAALVEERALKASRQQRNLYIAGAVALIIILCCIVAGFFSRSMTGLFGIINNPIPSSTQPADSQPLGPTPEIVREDANSVQPGVYPATRLEASKLFGGVSTDWTGSKANGWTMLGSNLLTVRVPKGMKAVLVSGANLQTTTLIGPVLIKNVDAIKITCQ